MTDVQPSRDRPAYPFGLLGMILLVAVVELGLIRGNLNFMENVAVSWKYTGRVVKRKAVDNSILCFGDSMLKFGVLPKIVADTTGQKTYSLAILSGSAPSSYYLFRRALEAGAKPKAVVVDFARGILGDGPASTTRPYPWVELLKTRELVELCWATKDADFAGATGLQRILHSVRGRHEIRAHVLARLQAKPTDRLDVIPALWRNWETNRGGQANPKVEPFDDPVIPPTAPIKAGTWRCDPVNEIYLQRFLDLAASRGITVYWTLTPVTPGTFSHWIHSGDEQRYVEFVRRQQARFKNVVVLDARESGYESSVFVDGVHLDRDGATILSEALAESVRESMALPKSERPTWVFLPSFDTQAPQVAVEDVGQSRMLLRSLSQGKRR